MTILNPFFGKYGGQYVPEVLLPALNQLEKTFVEARNDPEFKKELSDLLNKYAGRPTPLTLCRNITKGTKTKIYLKREDLLHGGAHKTNQVLGQALLAKRMGKTRIIAETGAGQHGVATATVAALFDMECVVYMGAEDVERQSLNAYRMELLGAKVHAVESGTRTLKDAINEAMRDWATNIETTFYCIGSVMGPHPYPTMVRDFQKIIGEETKEQMKEIEGKLPDAVFACVGGGSNAMGIFDAFLNDLEVNLIGVEAGGTGTKHASTLSKGKPGVLHGSYSYLLHDEFGRIMDAHSISAGLDYPGVGPEHSYLKEIEREE